MSPLVAISTVDDGSMYNRHDHADPKVIDNRKTYLEKNNINPKDATRLHPNANQRAEVAHETDWCQYTVVDSSSKGLGIDASSVPASDALITTEKNLAIFLPVADCVGAALFDPTHQVLAVAHFGRHSLEQQGIVKLTKHFVDHYDSDPAEIKVWLTPAPGKDIYPIWALDNKGMKEVTFEQLDVAGILPANIVDNPAETDKDKNYFSYSEWLKGNRNEDGDHAIVAMMTD